MRSELVKYQETRPTPRDSDLAVASDVVEIKSPISFRQALQVFLDRWWLILVLAILAALGAGYFVHRIPATYSARAVLQVEQEEHKLIRTDEFSGEDLRSSEVLNTIVHNIKNTRVLRRVVQANRLSSNPDFLPGKKNLSQMQLIRALSGMITAKLRQDTRLIDITVSHSNPELATRLANSVAEEFIRQNLDERFSTTTAANELLYAEAEKLKCKLEDSEKQVQAYKEANQTVSMEERQNIIVEKLKELNKSYTDAKADRLRKEADFKQIDSFKTNPDALLALPAVQEDSAISELHRKIVREEAHVATLSLRYKSKYPKMMQAERQLNDLKQTLRALALTFPASVQSAYQSALAREKNLEAALREVQAESLALDQKNIQYNVLMREVQSDRALYDSVLKRLKETDISKGLERAAIAVVEPASLPTAPMKPPTWLMAAAAFALMAFLSFAAFYIARLANTSLKTVDEAELVLGLPVWAAIPATAISKKKPLPHVIAEEPGSICSESFRTLRTTTNLNGHAEKKILIFASADPSEGKSFCSLNHALCQAQEGKRTLLIDFDLRRPSIAKSFSLPPETPGVTDYLTGKDSFRNLVRITPYKNLHVLPAGPKISNPAEHMSLDAVKRLVEEAAREFDRVIIDTAPINAVSDAFIIFPLADIVCLVVRTGKTPKSAVQRAIQLMARAHVPPSGIVLNFLPKRSGRGYYNYYSADYSYGERASEPRPAAALIG